MKTTAFGLVFILGSVACTQSPQAPPGSATPALSSDAAPDPTSSNPRSSLPAMSADRCKAEALGTATDPETGVPAGAGVDPQTGKPICPPARPNPEPKPLR
jgi:hypothetical protein